MTRRFIDLSIYLENEVLSDPPPLAPKITYQKHQETLKEFMAMIPGTTPADYPDGEAAAAEWVTMTTHSGTHLDAPYHFHSTMDAKTGEKKRSITIDEVPLAWCFQPGVKLDFRHFPDGYVATAADVEAELKRIGHDLQPLDIVVVNTRAGSRYGHNDYVSAGCGMGYEATIYLLERGVRLTGTDAWSWDAPFSYTAQKIAETGDKSLIWKATRPAATSGIATSRSCTTSKHCRTMVFMSAASRTRSGAVRPAGPAPWPSSTTACWHCRVPKLAAPAPAWRGWRRCARPAPAASRPCPGRCRRTGSTASLRRLSAVRRSARSL